MQSQFPWNAGKALAENEDKLQNTNEICIAVDLDVLTTELHICCIFSEENKSDGVSQILIYFIKKFIYTTGVWEYE